MDEKKKNAGPERVGSWKTASPSGVSTGDRSDGSAASGFIAGRPTWESEDEVDEEMDGATMDGGALTTGAAPVGAMPEEDDVSGAARTAAFTRSSAGADSDTSAQGASRASSSSEERTRPDAARGVIPEREAAGPGAEGASGNGAARSFAGVGSEERSGGEEDRAGKVKEKVSEAQQRAAEAGKEAQQRIAEAGQKASSRLSDAGQKASGKLSEAGHQAGGKLSQVGHKASRQAKSQFNQRKERLAGRLEGLRGQFSERAQAPTQQWVERVGHRADEVIDRTARTLREKDADELLGLARSELRQRPVLYASGMLALGFLAARALRSMEGSDAIGS